MRLKCNFGFWAFLWPEMDKCIVGFSVYGINLEFPCFLVFDYARFRFLVYIDVSFGLGHKRI